MRYEVDGCLACFSVLDVLPSRVASVYLCYNPDLRHMQWGRITALREIALTDRMRRVSPALRWFDLNFIVPQCSRMDYKAEYKPSLLLCPYTHKWVPLTKRRLGQRGAAKNGPLVDLPAGGGAGSNAGSGGGEEEATGGCSHADDSEEDDDVAVWAGQQAREGAGDGGGCNASQAGAGQHAIGAPAHCDPDSNAERFDHPAGDMVVAARLDALFAVALPAGADSVGAWAGDLRAVTLSRAHPVPAARVMELAEAAQETVLADLDGERRWPGVPVAALPMPRLAPAPGPTPPKGAVTLPEPRMPQWPAGSAVRRIVDAASQSEKASPAPSGFAMVHVSGTDQYLDVRDISRGASEAMDKLLPELRCLLSPRLEARTLIDPRGVMHFARLDRQLQERTAAAAAERAAAAAAERAAAAAQHENDEPSFDGTE